MKPGLNRVLRILTLLCYFLPFIFFHTTCVGSDYRAVYNKEEAIANEKEALGISHAESLLTDTTANQDTSGLGQELKARTRIAETKKKKKIDWTNYFFSPCEDSLSAPGALVLFKNILMPIVLVLSMLISLITIFILRFLNEKRWIISIDIFNTISLLVFLADCLVSSINVLWGFWVVLGLLGLQIFISFKYKNLYS